MVNTFDASKPVTFGDIVSGMLFLAFLPAIVVLFTVVLSIDYLRETYIEEL